MIRRHGRPGSGRLAKRLANVVLIEIRIRLDDLRRGHAIGDHRDDGRDGNPQAADAGRVARLVGIDRDS